MNGEAALNGDLRRERTLALKLQSEWTKAIDDEQWAIYAAAIDALRRAGIRFLLGGGFALAAYIGRWRNTKDIDFYIMQTDRDAAVEALTKAGFGDLFPQLPYDRKWIYRSTRDGVIVDIIWAMANQRAQVDDVWFARAPVIKVRDAALPVVPVEEFLWCKLYIMQRDHCDWTDVFNVLYAAGPQVDWEHVLKRAGEDWPLLKGLLTVFGWLCPGSARELPEWLQQKLQLPEPTPSSENRDRVRLLDSRDWFAGVLPKEKPLEV